MLKVREKVEEKVKAGVKAGIRAGAESVRALRAHHIKVRKFFGYALGMLIGFALISLLLDLKVDFSSFYNFAKSPLTFSLLNFAGHIFFIPLPGEELMFFYYLSTGISHSFIVLLAVTTAMAAQVIDYWIGRSVSLALIDRVVKPKRYKIAERYVHEYGGLVIFVFNVMPFSSPIILLAAGMMKYRFRKAVVWSLLGLITKYFAIVAIHAWLA